VTEREESSNPRARGRIWRYSWSVPTTTDDRASSDMVIPRIFAPWPCFVKFFCSAVGAAHEGWGKQETPRGFHFGSEVGMLRKFRELLPPFKRKGMIVPAGTAARARNSENVCPPGCW